MEQEDLVLKIEDFDTICRICFSANSLSSIFDVSYENKNLAEILFSCASIQVHNNDGLPKNMCHTCIQNVCSVYSFIELCNNSNSMLLSIVNDNEDTKDNIFLDVKSENNDSKLSEFGNEVKPQQETNETDDKQMNKQATTMTVAMKPKSTTLVCKPCNEKFSSIYRLKKHYIKVQHPTDFDYVCPICRRSKLNLPRYKQHLQYHFGMLKCKVCQRHFNFNNTLRKHMESHTTTKYVCYDCGKIMFSYETLQTHKKKHHQEAAHMCHVCGVQVSGFENYNKHLEAHLLEDDITETLRNDPLFVGKKNRTNRKSSVEHTPQKCEICLKDYNSKYTLKAHMKRHSGKRPFLCACGKSFKLSSDLTIHRRTHTGEKPYKCEYCARCFVQKQQLTTHRRIHTQEKPYACQYCGKSFATKGNATVHIRLHTGETPYKCNVCDKGYIDSSSLKRHKLKHEKNLENVFKEEVTITLIK